MKMPHIKLMIPASFTFLKSSNRALEASISPKAMKSWKLLYCGGSQPVVDALTAISTRVGIEFHTEKFDW
jgi:hypothetical protein